MGQERLGPSYFFISLVLGPLNSLLWYVPSSRHIWSVCVYYCSTYYKVVRVGGGGSRLPCSWPGEFPTLCVFITAVPVPIIKLFAWGVGDSGGHVLRETTSRGLSGLVCPSRTSERGGEGDCVKEGGGEGDRKKERGLLLCHSLRH